MVLEDIDAPVGELLERHLPILIDVAQAVAFAHSRGIIHRDIKPSQVMVGEFGEVLLLDWGLALPCAMTVSPSHGAVEPVASSGDPNVPDAETWTSCPAGTPAFMAPEQTDATPHRLGRWTDVYLLGGTLYFLLTGTVPRPAMDAAEAFLAAMHEEIEPPRQRAPDRDIPADLEQLAMRALQRDARQRPTATELVVSLQASLSGAGQRRESRSLTRSIGRALLAMGSTYAELSQGLADLARAEGLWKANPAISGLREELHQQYAEAAVENGDLELARRQAAQLTNAEARQRIEATISQRAAALRQTAVQRRVFLGVSVALAVVLVGLAVTYTVDQHRAQRRLEAQRNAAVAARVQAEELTSFMLEDLTPGLESLGRLDLLDQVARSAVAYYESVPADASDGGILTRRSLALRNAARVLRDQGHLDEARTAAVSSLDVAAELADQHPESAKARAELADRWLELGELMQGTADPTAARQAVDTAVALYEELLAEGREQPGVRHGLARALFGVAYEAWGSGRFEPAQEALRRAEQILVELIADRPSDLGSSELLLEVRARHGHVLRDAGELRAAVGMTREAVAIGEALVEAEPTNVMYRSGLAECYSSLGFALWQLEDLETALRAYERALSIHQELAERDPSNRHRLRRLADSRANVGEMQHELGETDRALSSLSAAVTVLEELVAGNPENADWSYSLAAALLELGHVHAARDDSSAARSAWRRAAEAMEAIASQRADMYYLDTYARALLLLGDVDAARPVAEELMAKGWSNPEFEALCRRHGLDGS
jgi:tetratricopeptide (TPR) repeat protein